MSEVVGPVQRQLRWWLTKIVVRPYLAFCIAAVRWRFRPVIVAVTGSVGKTTTTTMIAGVLKHPDARPVVGGVGYTRNNMNSHWGVPLTILRHDHYLADDIFGRLRELLGIGRRLLRMRDYPGVLVLELGTSRKGMLDRLARLARPQIGVVTTVGPSHLENLKTLEGVAEEKSAVVRWTSPSGLVVLGGGHEHIELLRSKARAPVIIVEGRGIELARNIARVIGRRLGVPDSAIEAALADPDLPKGRLNRIELGDITVIDDSYNANPLSMKLGLDTLAESTTPGRRVAVLGAMAELGDLSSRYHREIGEYARGRCDKLIGVGDAARGYAPDRWFATSHECAERLGELVGAGDCVLVKGSASIGMAVIIEELRKAWRPIPAPAPETHLTAISNTL